MTAQLLTPTGGTRAWRRTCAVVLWRDGHVCRMTRDGHPCGAVATTVNHIVPRVLGGSDRLSNLEAACVPCNMGAGGRLTGAAAVADMLDRHHTVTAIVTKLDALGVPFDAGRRRAATALAAHTSHPWRSADVELACTYRRTRGPLTRI